MFGAACAAISASRKQAGAEVRNDYRNRRVPRRHRRHGKRIAEPHIEPARQTQLLPDTNRQQAAVHEHGASVTARRREHRHAPLIVNRHLVHGGKQARRSEPELADARSSRDAASSARRIEHERADDVVWMTPGRRGDRCLVAGHTRDQHRAIDPMTIELLPLHRSASSSSVPGALPPSICGRASAGSPPGAACIASATQRAEKRRGKEMAVGVANHFRTQPSLGKQERGSENAAITAATPNATRKLV